jgi:hypothetical protein
MLAALHGLDAGPRHAILGPADWAGFLAGQRATVAARQRAVQLPDLWLSQIEVSWNRCRWHPGGSGCCCTPR